MHVARLSAALLVVAGCTHDLGALRARGETDGGPDAPVAAETPPAVIAEDPAVGGAITCMLDGIAERGGEVAGLGRGADTATATVDRTMVSACVRADFVAAAPTERVVVSARQVTGACGDECTTACGTAPSLHVFTGDDRGYRRVASLTPGTELADEVVPVGDTIRYVVLCRGSEPATHDDLEVDYLAAVR
jgi:hypothetical protein